MVMSKDTKLAGRIMVSAIITLILYSHILNSVNEIRGSDYGIIISLMLFSVIMIFLEKLRGYL